MDIGISNADIARGISKFKPLPHRFQSFMEIEGVEFVNDSKATNVDSTIKALLSLQKPVILIAGGRDKASDFNLAKELIREKVRSLVLIGEATERIMRSMKDSVHIRQARTLEEAVELSYGMAKSGDVILLSPMCASFDMFGDYKGRGEAFMRAVSNLSQRLCVK